MRGMVHEAETLDCPSCHAAPAHEDHRGDLLACDSCVDAQSLCIDCRVNGADGKRCDECHGEWLEYVASERADRANDAEWEAA